MDFFYESNEAFVPRILLGKVVANYDGDYKGMVKVAYHSYGKEGNVSDWMKVISPSAGKGRGMYFLPEVGDEVVIAFLNNDINNPVVIGSVWSGDDVFPDGAVTEENTGKAIITKSGVRVEISDVKDKESITVSTPQETEIIIAGGDDSVTIKDGGAKHTIKIDGKSGNISISSNGSVNIKSKTTEITADEKLTLKAGEIVIESKGKLAVKGVQAEINSSALMKISSTGIAELKGSMVKING